MKKQILLFVLTLLPMMACADAINTSGNVWYIDGIWYVLNSTTKEASVFSPHEGGITWDPGDMEGGYAYFYWDGYYGSVDIPSSVMGDGTEYTVTSIRNVAIEIGDGCFLGDSGLTSVTIPNSVTSLGQEAFYGCTNLINVYCLAENVPAASSNSFPNNYITLYVPEATINKYKTTSPWSGFKEIKALPDDMLEDPEIPGAERCATPSISFVDGDLTFTCETEDVEFVPTVTCTPTYTLNGNKMKMGVTFNISVYARRDGYNKSDVATKTIEAKELGDMNGDGQLTISDITILVDIIMKR